MPRRGESQVFHDQLNRISRELATGKADSSFALYPLENQSSHKLWDEDIAYLAGSLLAPAQTRLPWRSSMCRRKRKSSWISSLVLTELPRLTTIPFLISKRSCWNWRPVTTVAFAHRASTDIVYGNPTRHIVYLNPDSDKFDPERWLISKGKIRHGIKFPSYGFGCRHKPRPILDHLQNLPRASFEIAQDLQNPIDETGFVDSVILHPKPFNARFQPGFEDEALLRDAMAQYGEEL
ncbi:hypothetical protein DFJ58DRAFT_840723 [Suillus subalutaceus]|uniref:uncharacterized protein n=1 Tax=Suillus subalutaceus TaxID=48586 RepID=UPI001B86D7F4|nr:uncharacterized protein DFJ58DRAFT_840723 [Suillus subalutaceus]KAG1856993.1 hypothetical protein DFJ58DRAFT_840723 [Suillus subalutaceus]